MAKLLITRFSAFGDVAMTVPIVYSLAKQYPELQIVFLSRGNLSSLFQFMPPNVEFRGIDLNNYKGIAGLNRLYKELKEESFNAYADFHDVLRTKFLRARLALSGVQIAKIEKGRAEKKKLTQKNNKQLHPLPTTFDRYTAVLEQLSYPITASFRSLFGNSNPDLSQLPIKELQHKDTTEQWIGFAPFAKHRGKVYPPELMLQVIQGIEKENRKLILFGGGKEEIDWFEEWKKENPQLIVPARQLNLTQELMVMSQLNCMVSMDSANMHLASLVNTPVISIWGATHPYSGFLGWNQKEENIIQLNMSCRPCSVFGNKPCYRKDYACLNDISPQEVINKIEGVI